MFSIKRMLCYVTGVGIAVAAMANPSEMIASVVLNFTIALYCTIVVAAFIVPMPKQTYYVSFAVFCGVYLLLTSQLAFGNQYLLPDILFYEIEKFMWPSGSAEPSTPYGVSLMPESNRVYTPFYGEKLDAAFRASVHRHTIWRASWSILMGEIAGIVALFIVRRKAEKGLAEKSRPIE